MLVFRGILLIAILTIVFSCGGPDIPETIALEYKELPDKLDFNQDVKPILSDKCYLCHGPDKAKISAGLQLHSAETAFSELPESPGKYAIDPGSLKKSEMFYRIISEDPKIIMPTPESHLTLTAKEKAILIKWIEDGAEYKDHWAFIPIEKTDPPKVKAKELVRNPIDNYVLSKLEKHQLSFTKEADKEILLRRLSFDLTGMPPTVKEIDDFLNDSSANAYEKQVDRLLASERYGEQMALEWMDVARFADTHGYSVDRYRDMSPWRDWVIDAFNKNQPYDQFITWQLAGDLLDNPTKEMKLATAFNRIHPQNMEGGIVNEEFLIEYAGDRATTTGQALMGLTVACAKCHDHKYDPVSQKNYYEMTTFFNNINESGQISWNDALPTPTMLWTTEEEEKMLEYMANLVKENETEVAKTTQELMPKSHQWIASKSYAGIKLSNKGLVGSYDLNNTSLVNSIRTSQKGTMKREYTEGQPIDLVTARKGKGIKFNGDTWLDLKEVGVFGRHEPFTVGVWAKIPEEVTDGNIFHKSDGAILHAWRGYHLKIVDNKLEILMAHTGPDNAIKEHTKIEIPKDVWTHFAVTYDGSSKATGYKVYMNGKELETEVIVDNLYKNILFGRKKEPALQFGARLRGKGIPDGIMDDIRVYNRELSGIEMLQLAENKEVHTLLAKSPEALESSEKLLLQQYYTLNASSVKEKYAKLTEVRKAYVDSIEPIKEVMIMKESEPIQAYVLERGVYDARAEEVFPSTPEFLPPMSEDTPKNRLGFAKWLFKKEHPLTSRVAVNRMWQHFFGIGLVKTSEDFGNQGELPSHPQLLDYLAANFMENGWDMKAFNKMLVMSATYRQDSRASQELRDLDPENRLLAHGPAKRMTGEMLRDNALAASGLLSEEIGGESVHPYQPPGLWKVNGMTYKADTGEKLYRRSMYTIWKRSVPHPTLATFDAPARDVCTIRRQETNTPLQALVLLNDPTYIESARVLGKKMADTADAQKGIQYVFRSLTGRNPTQKELKVLLDLKNTEYKKFVSDDTKMKGWLNSGEFRLEDNDDKALIAANAIVASTIMNSDATITKR
ncbi:DUF1553 domain-containing protein [Aquimarina sp. AD10]|uniref:DUF1553 domain-containing protein n=1 Tax=Aquimarina sp. AD10 TaxID=1714849 RepID=UPI000E4F0BCD|nr:DUF1553 domain-containing protein [Aquimarina sp. AD10]AXT60553.1 DUF1553 domain-containing protein [Aquimarina sp. AD10]RKN01645.1 DUF1553 domain-containing protein [Aquimarina sp. AD10]